MDWIPNGVSRISALRRASGADAVLLPKVDSPDTVSRGSCPARTPSLLQPICKIWIMAETPRGVLALERIARQQQAPRRDRDGHCRSRQGTAPRSRTRIAPACCRHSATASWQPGHRVLIYSTAFLATLATTRASALPASRARRSDLTARASFTRDRSTLPTMSSVFRKRRQ